MLVLPAAALSQDTDADGLSDSDEILLGSDPYDADTDNDGLLDGFEAATAMSLVDADSDDDGLSDGTEYGLTNPLSNDTDLDGLQDGLESGVDQGIASGVSDGGAMIPYLGTNPAVFEPDADTLTQTDPLDPDTDGDGLLDGFEDANRNGAVEPGEIDPANADTDADGISDGEEYDVYPPAPDTDDDGIIDALDTDSDDDGLGDQVEGNGDFDGDLVPNFRDRDSDDDGFDDGDPLEGLADDDDDGMPNFLDADSPAIDTDGDGLTDALEQALGTDPESPDSDADGIGDEVETDGGLAVDTDYDAVIDALDADSDADAVTDLIEGVFDSDDDGVPDYRDADDDGDGLPTLVEGVGDPDMDGLPNYLDTDSDDDGFADDVETAAESDPYDRFSTPENVHVPVIAAVADLGNDQGRRVRISWEPSDRDAAGSPQPVLSYSVYRRIDAAKTAAADRPFVAHATAPGAWDFVLNLPASGEALYNTLAETLCDSTEAGVCWSTFFVRAHTAAPTTFFDSAPDSGYSIDNLAPGVPYDLYVAYGQDNVLTWHPSDAADFRYFKVYRSDTPRFTPGPDNLVRTTITSTWTDVAAGMSVHYLVSAVDFAGNESAPALPAALTDASDAVPRVWSLGGAVPNPFNPRTVISYEVPGEGGPVSLQVFDLAGRRVRTLLREFRPAGLHSVVWSGEDDAGRSLPAGAYFCRLEGGGFSATRRLMLVK
jgi:hypothetical protein